MGEKKEGLEAPMILQNYGNFSSTQKRRVWAPALCFLFLCLVVSLVWLVETNTRNRRLSISSSSNYEADDDVVESNKAVVAADDKRCSEIGAGMLEKGGHAVDAAVATALCLGVVSPASSGIGGGAFMLVRSSSPSVAIAIDMRETAPADASQNMYEKNTRAQSVGALSMGVPGELAGLRVAWSKYGRLPWKTLFQPAIQLARNGFVVSPYLGTKIANEEEKIMNDPGLRHVFAPEGKLSKAGDVCYNLELGNSLSAVAEQGPEAFYNGPIGQKLVADVRKLGGILSMEDLRSYKVNVVNAVEVNVMGHTILGMLPPSSGTVGLSLVLNVLDSYGSRDAIKGPLGLHRLIEALKHMFAVRMDLGDPAFVNVTKTVSNMLSPSFARSIREKIFDNTTFPPDYYLPRWSQLRDHGTSHFCVVDSERNAVSMTTTVNYAFGGGVLSPSTGIVLNNEMNDFSIPTDVGPGNMPPAPSNFIRPKKRPLSSMTPIIVLKDNELAGVIGGSGGLDIIPAVTQVFINHFILGMEPLEAVESARVYHKLFPNVVSYENWTVIDGEHIELAEEKRRFLRERGHRLQPKAGGAICQLVVQNLTQAKINKATNAICGTLTAVSDPRKGGCPAAAAA